MGSNPAEVDGFFQDVKKPHSNLWKIVAGMAINGIILKILKHYHTDNVVYVKIGK